MYRGTFAFSPNIPEAACGAWVEALDLATCTPTGPQLIRERHPEVEKRYAPSAMRFWQSSSGAGVACRATATRAQAVSSRLTDLSGSWRAGM